VAIVVSDTSPIRALHHLGLLETLSRLFEVVFLPPAVLGELERVPDSQRPAELSSYAWVRVQRPSDEEQVLRLEAQLDRGEAEAIALALELNADLLIDEADGREVARRLGLARIGVLGILVRCKARGWIAEVRPLLERLQAQLNFYISPALRDEVLRIAGEPTDQDAHPGEEHEKA